MVYRMLLASSRQSLLAFANTFPPRTQALSSLFLRRSLVLTLGLLLAASSNSSEGSDPFFLGTGDSIGPTSSATGDRGGFTAVQQGDQNLGEPAIAVTLTGQEVLDEFRIVVFGIPSPSGKLMFNEFDYRLKFWKSPDYFSDAEPEFEVGLGDPIGLQLVSHGPTNVAPMQPFGNAGIFGSNADTYDFHFDLTSLPLGEPAQQMLKKPLSAGEWVIAFQSQHDADNAGILGVATSGAAVGSLPLLSRDDDIPRGILGGQDPAAIFARWGITAMAKIPIQGDFNDDGSVGADDLRLWQSSLGIDDNADADRDGDSDGADFLAWQRTNDINPVSFQFGDFDRNNRVDQDDLALWNASYGSIGAADADDDGDSDGADFLAWQRNLGARLASSPLIAIPEPGLAPLVLTVMLCMPWTRRSACHGHGALHAMDTALCMPIDTALCLSQNRPRLAREVPTNRF